MVEKREWLADTGYEVQIYNSCGNRREVIGCDTLEELATVLARFCNSRVAGNFPTVWYEGRRWPQMATE